MSDPAIQRLARQVRALRGRLNWLAVGVVIAIALQSVTLGLWVAYEVRMHRARQSVQEIANDMQRAVQQLHNYRTSGGR